jgi:hypothetical protein
LYDILLAIYFGFGRGILFPRMFDFLGLEDSFDSELELELELELEVEFDSEDEEDEEEEELLAD